MDGSGCGDVGTARGVFLEFPRQRNLAFPALSTLLGRARIQQISQPSEDDPDHATDERYDYYKAKQPKDNANHRLI
jgi:hypothetical protein